MTDTARGEFPDPRPLLGEPLSLDLLNTVWIDSAGPHDLLDDLTGLQLWLDTHQLLAPVAHATRVALQAARDAVRAHVEAPDRPVSVEQLNAVLAHGRLSRTLTDSGPQEVLTVDRPEHLPGWRAAENYLHLLARDPRRIRRCRHPACVLRFYDTSPKNNRRWCSMAGCGNRSKAARHYDRTKHTKR